MTISFVLRETPFPSTSGPEPEALPSPRRGEGEAEATLLAQGDRHRLAAHEVDHRFVDGKAGIGMHHLVARVDERGDDEVHDGLRAGRHHDLIGSDRDAARALHVLYAGPAALSA